MQLLNRMLDELPCTNGAIHHPPSAETPHHPTKLPKQKPFRNEGKKTEKRAAPNSELQRIHFDLHARDSFVVRDIYAAHNQLFRVNRERAHALLERRVGRTEKKKKKEKEKEVNNLCDRLTTELV